MRETPKWQEKPSAHPDGLVSGRALAKVLGVSPAAVTKWKNAGDIRPEVILPTGVNLYNPEKCRRIAMDLHPEAFAGGGHGGKRENSGRLNDTRDGTIIAAARGRPAQAKTAGASGARSGPRQGPGPTQGPGPGAGRSIGGREASAIPGTVRQVWRGAERAAIDTALEATFGPGAEADLDTEDDRSPQEYGRGGTNFEDQMTEEERRQEWETQRKNQRTLTEARTRQTLLKIHGAELDLLERKGKVLPRAPLEEAITRYMSTVVQAIENLPKRTADSIAAELKLDEEAAKKIREMLDKKVLELRNQIAKDPLGEFPEPPAPATETATPTTPTATTTPTTPTATTAPTTPADQSAAPDQSTPAPNP